VASATPSERDSGGSLTAMPWVMVSLAGERPRALPAAGGDHEAKALAARSLRTTDATKPPCR
jgi:hypothetical protein